MDRSKHLTSGTSPLSGILAGILGAVLGLALLSAAPSAHAQEASAAQGAAQSADRGGFAGVLRPSKLYTFGGGVGLEHGFGLNLDYRLYPDRRVPLFIGPFAQGQWETGEAFRVAGGINLGFGMFGIQVGVSHRTASGPFAASTGLHLAKTVTFGPVSVGGRLTIPLVDHIDLNSPTAATAQGIEGALIVSMGWDFVVQGQRPASLMGGGGCHHGHGHGHGHH